MTSTTVHFAETARVIAASTARLGLDAPVFRSPPRDPHHDRTLRRRPDGQAVVSVRVAGRPFAAVQSDLVEGVVAANQVADRDAQQVRRQLWSALAVADHVETVTPLAAA